MAKKNYRRKNNPSRSSENTDKNLSVTKQTAGGITGAVVGGIVAGPVGAIAGGVAGAMVGDASAQGKKPIKRAAQVVRSELTEGRTLKALKSVTGKRKTAKKKSKGAGNKASVKLASKKTKGSKKSKSAMTTKKRAKKKR